MLYDTPNPLTGKTHFGWCAVRAVELRLGHEGPSMYTGISRWR